MDRIFTALNETVQKSTIEDFRDFLKIHKGVTRWLMSSSYCIGEENKPNDVISFVLFPYIFNFTQWQEIVNTLQNANPRGSKNNTTLWGKHNVESENAKSENDINHTYEKQLSDEFCDFADSGAVFTFSFLLDKERNCFDRWQDRESLYCMVDSYIAMMDLWTKDKPQNKRHYDELKRSLTVLKSEMNADMRDGMNTDMNIKKNFDFKLLAKTLVVCFLASYLKYLLFSEVDVDKFSWMPDGDNMTALSNGVYKTIYEILSYCICENKLPDNRKQIISQVTDCIPADPNHEMFYGEFVQLPSYFSNLIADYNMKDNSVSSDENCEGIERILADNQFLSVILIKRNQFARIGYAGLPQGIDTIEKRMTGFVIHSFALTLASIAALLAQSLVKDEAVLTSLTISMIMLIAHINGVKWKKEDALSFLGTFIGYYVETRGVNFLFKWIPIAGNAVNAVVTLFTTEVLGWATYIFVNETGVKDFSRLSEPERKNLLDNAKELRKTEKGNSKKAYRRMNKSDEEAFDKIVGKLQEKSILDNREHYLADLEKIALRNTLDFVMR